MTIDAKTATERANTATNHANTAAKACENIISNGVGISDTQIDLTHAFSNQHTTDLLKSKINKLSISTSLEDNDATKPSASSVAHTLNTNISDINAKIGTDITVTTHDVYTKGNLPSIIKSYLDKGLRNFRFLINNDVDNKPSLSGWFVVTCETFYGSTEVMINARSTWTETEYICRYLSTVHKMTSWVKLLRDVDLIQNSKISEAELPASSAVTANLQQQINQYTRTIAIDGDEDLNNDKFWTVGKYYCCSNDLASTLTNCPTQWAFTMDVTLATGNAYPCQTITEYWTGRTIRRVKDLYLNKTQDWIEPNGALRSGRTQIQITEANSVKEAHVTFDTPFLKSDVPRVILQIVDSSNDLSIYTSQPFLGNPTRTGFDIRIKRATTGTVSVDWIAMQ